MAKYEYLEKHIQLVDERNSDSITDRVLGINIDKYFMPSVANVIGTDLSKYKLLRKGRFACNPMHVGRDERLPVALFSDDAPGIVSPAYFMFEIIDENVLDREFLMMWMRRPEFDRQCWLRTDGSVRGGITWDDICRMELPVPELSVQKKIVRSYNVIADRIELKQRINDNLSAVSEALFAKTFIQAADRDSWPTVNFAYFISNSFGGDWGQESPQGNYSAQVACIRGTDIPSLAQGSISDAPIRYILPKNLDAKRICADNFVVEISGGSPVQSTGRIAIVPEQVLSYRGADIICSNFCKVVQVSPVAVYYFLQYWNYLYRAGRMFDYENSSTGLKNFDFTSFVEKEHIPLPPIEVLVEFNNRIKPLLAELFNSGFEIQNLKATRDHILPRLMLHGI